MHICYILMIKIKFYQLTFTRDIYDQHIYSYILTVSPVSRLYISQKYKRPCIWPVVGVFHSIYNSNHGGCPCNIAFWHRCSSSPGKPVVRQSFCQSAGVALSPYKTEPRFAPVLYVSKIHFRGCDLCVYLCACVMSGRYWRGMQLISRCCKQMS